MPRRLFILSFLTLVRMRYQCADDSQAEVRDAAFAVISLLSKYHGDAFTQELSEGDIDRSRHDHSSPHPRLHR